MMDRMCRNCGFGGPAESFRFGWCSDCELAWFKGAFAMAITIVVGSLAVIGVAEWLIKR